MAQRTSTLLLLGANVLIPIAILIFASGFFPYKPFLAGLAEYEHLEYGPPPKAPFDKVVFMVVDALRSDFVYSGSSGFSFTQSLISSGAAIPFTAHATSPTITMPRIKAITTGSIPSFLDVILNFAESDTTSTLATQDTWLAQMRAKEAGKLVMYGDDTWLKLFPDTFDRADGTSSFFVSDFTEVDNNVTRHIPEELTNDDWNTMVLHYLGLDHIGHKAGPRSLNMIPKQREMDMIVRQIYEAVLTSQHLESTLLVLCGDHGMNDAGNHGGSAPGETSPALVFISPKLTTISRGHAVPAQFQDDFQYYKTIEQSDIAPTLGALLGFPIPRNNLGAFIPEFLPFWPSKNDRTQILLRNARQILSVVTATFPSFEHAGPSKLCEEASSSVEELACSWRDIAQRIPLKGEDQDIDAWLLATTKWLRQAQELMSSTASNYNVSKLVAGQALAILALVLAFGVARSALHKSFKKSSAFLGVTLSYGLMMFASSFVEEEQHFWYWATTAWLMLLWIKGNRKQSISPRTFSLGFFVVLSGVRVVRRWNQTGQKFAGEPDIARTYFFNNTSILWILVGITYLWVLNAIATKGFSQLGMVAAGASSAILGTAAITFKLAFTIEDSPELLSGAIRALALSSDGLNLVTRARLVFASIGTAVLYIIITGSRTSKRPNTTMKTIHDLITLFLVTQSRATNIPLFLLFEIQFLVLNSIDLSVVEISTTSLLLQQFSFFAFGNSNAISSIDLSSAYNGVSGYNVLAVGILTFVSNWSGPIFWTSATNIMLLRLQLTSRSDKTSLFWKHFSILTVFVTASLAFVMMACTVLRTHLFIWTVFSPKYLYIMAWSVGQHLGMNLGFGGLLWWLGRKYQ